MITISEVIRVVLSNKISTSLDINTVWDALAKAQQYKEAGLEKKCFKYIYSDASNAVTHPQFYQLPKENVMTIMKSPILNCTESQLFNGVLLWGKTLLWKANETESTSIIKEKIADFIPYIHFENMAPEEFINDVVPSGVLSKDAESSYLLQHLNSLLPFAKKQSSTRINAAEISCSRNNTEGLESSQDTHWASNLAENSLNFKATCHSNNCYLSGFQITELVHYCETYLEFKTVSTIIRSSNQRILFSSISTNVGYPYRINLTEPVYIKSGREYNIYFRAERTPIDHGCCCHSFGQYTHQWDYIIDYKNFEKEISCKNIDIVFSDDNMRASYTTATKGLIPKLFFITTETKF